jgi:RNA polymerase sigma factor (sigma-70 family)
MPATAPATRSGMIIGANTFKFRTFPLYAVTFSPSEQPEQDPVLLLVSAVSEGREPSASEAEDVLDLLHRWLARRGLEMRDRDEVCLDAVARLIRVTHEGGLDPARHPGAWLRVVADHLAVDALRRQRAKSVEFDERRHAGAADDEHLAQMFERSVAAADVRRAMREAAEAEEHEIVRIVATWLGLAEANGDAPSSREVGARLGISHMTVQRGLQAFRRRLVH